jgi:hypothetical protein
MQASWETGHGQSSVEWNQSQLCYCSQNSLLGDDNEHMVRTISEQSLPGRFCKRGPTFPGGPMNYLVGAGSSDCGRPAQSDCPNSVRAVGRLKSVNVSFAGCIFWILSHVGAYLSFSPNKMSQDLAFLFGWESRSYQVAVRTGLKACSTNQWRLDWARHGVVLGVEFLKLGNEGITSGITPGSRLSRT